MDPGGFNPGAMAGGGATSHRPGQPGQGDSSLAQVLVSRLRSLSVGGDGFPARRPFAAVAESRISRPDAPAILLRMALAHARGIHRQLTARLAPTWRSP
jgi:hypothetical protein